MYLVLSLKPGATPEPPGDSGGIVWGVFVFASGESFVLSAGAAPGRFGQNRLGFFLPTGVCACVLVET